MRSALSALVLVAACGSEWSRSERGLTDAAEDRTHPAIGRYLFSQGGATHDASCTATLVGRKTLITAAHCAGYRLPEVELGDPPARYTVDRDLAHPDWSDGQAWLHDVALIVLRDAPPIDPMVVERRAAAVGEPVTLVGYGETALSAGDQGVKRRASNDVAALEAEYFTIEGTGGGEGNACRGDSGGPVLTRGTSEERLLGVLSYVPNLGQRCGDETWATRIDRYLPWLMAEAGGDLNLPDGQDPVLRIVQPEAGARIEGPVPVEVFATDDHGVARLSLTLDGVARAEVQRPDFQERWSLEVGLHQLLVEAFDTSGRRVMAQVSFEVLTPAEAEPLEGSGCRALPGRSQAGLDGALWAALTVGLGLRISRRRRPPRAGAPRRASDRPVEPTE